MTLGDYAVALSITSGVLLGLGPSKLEVPRGAHTQPFLSPLFIFIYLASWLGYRKRRENGRPIIVIHNLKRGSANIRTHGAPGREKR